MDPLLITVIIVAIALLFDFLNGWNDAANSIATIVSTRVLTPYQAVIWAAFFNFAAAFIFGTPVAKTVGKGLVNPEIVTNSVIVGGLIGAIIWTWVCSVRGIPISVSHALMGGFGGAAVMKAGFGALKAATWFKVAIFIVLSPIIGMFISFMMMWAIMWLFRNKAPGTLNWWFRKLQLLSSALFSLSHGANDAQKTMGIIYILLIANGYIASDAEIPTWVILACYTMISLGTLIGGWKVIRTLGQKLTKLQPSGGFCAETGGSFAIFGCALAGIPVSTTHTITGAIIGVGASTGVAAVRWGVAKNIVIAWALTLPGSAATAALAYLLIKNII